MMRISRDLIAVTMHGTDFTTDDEGLLHAPVIGVLYMWRHGAIYTGSEYIKQVWANREHISKPKRRVVRSKLIRRGRAKLREAET
jgi:hypothetical protein